MRQYRRLLSDSLVNYQRPYLNRELFIDQLLIYLLENNTEGGFF